MVTTQEFQRKYERLSDRSVTPSSESDIDADCLMAFDYEYQGQDAEVEIATDGSEDQIRSARGHIVGFSKVGADQ